MPKRATSTSFKPGNRAAVGHGPKSGEVNSKEFRAKAKSYGLEALDELVSIMRSEAREAERLKAIGMLLEYGFGRPGAMEPEQASSGLSGADVIRLLSVVPSPAELPPTEHEPGETNQAATPEAGSAGQDVAAAV